jgi:hypothetical protein
VNLFKMPSFKMLSIHHRLHAPGANLTYSLKLFTRTGDARKAPFVSLEPFKDGG